MPSLPGAAPTPCLLVGPQHQGRGASQRNHGLNLRLRRKEAEGKKELLRAVGAVGDEDPHPHFFLARPLKKGNLCAIGLSIHLHFGRDSKTKQR